MCSTHEVGGYLRFSIERVIVARGMPSFPSTAATKLRTRSKQVHLTVTETEDEKQLTLPVMIALSAVQVLLCCLVWVFSLFYLNTNHCASMEDIFLPLQAAAGEIPIWKSAWEDDLLNEA